MTQARRRIAAEDSKDVTWIPGRWAYLRPLERDGPHPSHCPGPRDVNSVDPRHAVLDGDLQCLRATEIGEAYELVVVLETEQSCRDMVSRRAKKTKESRERGLNQAHLVAARLPLHGTTIGRVR